MEAPAEFLEKLTSLPSEGGKIVQPEVSRGNLKAFKPLLHSVGFNPEKKKKHGMPSLKAEAVATGSNENKAIELNIPSPDLVSRKTAILEQKNEGN